MFFRHVRAKKGLHLHCPHDPAMEPAEPESPKEGQAVRPPTERSAFVVSHLVCRADAGAIKRGASTLSKRSSRSRPSGVSYGFAPDSPAPRALRPSAVSYATSPDTPEPPRLRISKMTTNSSGGIRSRDQTQSEAVLAPAVTLTQSSMSNVKLGGSLNRFAASFLQAVPS